ncbi:hypothetical protein [Parafrigoribacterium soli]|uniref:hypothetical protein n=1 Tax=Parafrigoribacterium soli TaxID=3144663 RepID=UPI0032EDFF6D
MATRWARVARGLVAAGLSLFVAAFCHIASGGLTPTLFALVSCFVISSFVCVALSGKRLSLPKLSASVVLSQFLFHSVFSLWTAAPSGFAHAGHVHGDVFAFTPLSPVVPADAGMWFAHLAAAAVTIAALRRGESAFWGLLRLARLRFARLSMRSLFSMLALARATSTPHPIAPVERVLPLRDLVLLHTSSDHRGPPSRAVLALAAV